MGLTFRKRDEFDKVMDDLGISDIDLVDLGKGLTQKNDKEAAKKEDPFAKFLEPKAETDEATAEKSDAPS